MARLFHLNLKATVESGQGKMTTQKSSLFLPRFSHFFFSSVCSLDCCKSLTNFQSPEKVDLDNFCQSFHLLYERMDF